MFKNIGGKIKGLAKAITFLGIVGSLVYAIVIWVQAGKLRYGGDALVGTGFLVLTVGSLASWISSLALYGFGQLIENSETIKSTLSSIAPIVKSTSNVSTGNQPIPKPIPSSNEPIPTSNINWDFWRCKKCYEKNPSASRFCKSCGEYR
ncbi:MAG: hypothetical protein FWF47_02725 [Clostridia bacterium]|nr:hypothetical protein [Clostridia bacterium]